jgi:hypothetical protein
MVGATIATRLVDVAVAAVREGCIGETVAALVAGEALAVARNPEAVAALQTIARDEADHAAFAYRLVAWALRVGGDEIREAVAKAFDDPFVFPESSPPAVEPALLHAYGRLSPSEIRAVADRALIEIVRPAARALLEPSSRREFSTRWGNA